MPSQLHNELRALARPGALETLTRIRRGIEKESLRITAEGKLAQTPHPAALGSALTHSSITTDYSEALLEFITPVSTSITDSLRMLEDIHSFVYRQLDEELLWAASMPCIVAGDAGIPVARYGSANVARMKTVYRYGLGHRYGRLMQTIAGIHYNWSMPDDYWERDWRDAGSPGELSAYVTERYLGLIRNFRRYSWLLIYLFGASPAVCGSFLAERDHHGLEPFDHSTRSFHKPDGTSLRMGDLGYNSAAQSNLNICYNSLENYVQTLRSAILQPHPGYAHIPCGQDGNYQQLSDSLLQIENEFYSPIRPKRVTNPGETALNALVRGGIEYIEVRCVDVSPFHPVGLDEQQIRFLDIFLLYCLLRDSPLCDDTQQAAQDANLEAVVNRGRQPDLMLDRNGDAVALSAWARELLHDMGAVAALYDRAFDGNDYAESLEAQAARIDDPQLTPSARILREMRERDLPFFRLAMSYSECWAEFFRKRPLATATETALREETARSLAAREAIEAAETLSFEEHLARYFAQYQQLQ
ncbi:MAG: glutamate--cysteine ligase [Halioglobus sp.]|nr:glutamate--cysteine ligase [Halioglobus sp.]